MKVLIIAYSIPFPLTSGAIIRNYHLLKEISRKNEVWYAALLDSENEDAQIPLIKEFCVEVITAHRRRRPPLAHVPGLISFALAGKPLELKFDYSDELAQKIHDLAARENFDIIQIENSTYATYLDALPAGIKSKLVLEFHNITFDQYDKMYRVQKNALMKFRMWLFSVMMRRWEPRVSGRFDCCVAVSEVDKALLLAANPRLKIEVAPNGVDTQEKQVLPLEKISPVLIFPGLMSYQPNSDAAIYFCQSIFPLIKNRVPAVELWIVGKNPPREVKDLAGEAIHVTGNVEAMDPYYERASVCVVPLRAGGGTRLKILESMAYGRPVVSTSIGCEGLEVVDNRHLFMADEPQAFAEKVVQLLTDEVLYRKMAAEARQLVVQKYDWSYIFEHLAQVYAGLAAGR